MFPPKKGFYSNFYSTFSKMRHKRNAVGGALLGLNIFDIAQKSDAIDRDLRTVKQAKPIEDETGWDRLQLMFSYDEYGEMSPEMASVIEGTLMGIFTGSMIGGTINSRENYLRFMEQNQATAFQSHLDAKKQLQDKVTLGFARGAWMWGWRLGVFCGSFMIITTGMSVYRGKSSVLEYSTAGGITGAVYKFKQGPKPMIAGGIIGAALGSFAGCISLALLYLTGTSMEDIRYWQYKWKNEHQQEKTEAYRKLRERDLDDLAHAHQEKVTETSEPLAAIPLDNIQDK